MLLFLLLLISRNDNSDLLEQILRKMGQIAPIQIPIRLTRPTVPFIRFDPEIHNEKRLLNWSARGQYCFAITLVHICLKQVDVGRSRNPRRWESGMGSRLTICMLFTPLSFWHVICGDLRLCSLSCNSLPAHLLRITLSWSVLSSLHIMLIYVYNMYACSIRNQWDSVQFNKRISYKICNFHIYTIIYFLTILYYNNLGVSFFGRFELGFFGWTVTGGACLKHHVSNRTSHSPNLHWKVNWKFTKYRSHNAILAVIATA